jgi:hypothetical protein
MAKSDIRSEFIAAKLNRSRHTIKPRAYAIGLPHKWFELKAKGNLCRLIVSNWAEWSDEFSFRAPCHASRCPRYAQQHPVSHTNIRWSVLTSSKNFRARVANRTDSPVVAGHSGSGAGSKLIQKQIEHGARALVTQASVSGNGFRLRKVMAP